MTVAGARKVEEAVAVCGFPFQVYSEAGTDRICDGLGLRCEVNYSNSLWFRSWLEIGILSI